MKSGRFFRIPEKPSELPTLWKEAPPLARDQLPDWLEWQDAADYRRLETVNIAGASPADQEILQAEIEELELARLIVDLDPINPDLRHVYMERPRDEAIWSIGVYRGPSLLELGPASIDQPVLTAEHVTDVAATFVADPFWIRRNGRWHMFFEVMNWKANKGEIGLATSDDGLHWRYEQIVLAEEFHLSYPHVFEVGGDVYLIPESFQDESVRLYRAKRFPHVWEMVGILLSGGYFADSTPFRFQDSWWLLTETGQQTDDTLRLFYADDLLGPWHEHPQSPVVAGDPRRSRPAGRVVVQPQRIVRFAQNCSMHYGSDVRAFELMHLSRAEFHERPITDGAILRSSGLNWNADGMHHIDVLQEPSGEWLAVVDGWRQTSHSATEAPTT